MDGFTPEQKLLKEKMEALVASYLDNDIRVKAKNADEMSKEMLENAVKDDFKKFMGAFVEFIARNNAALPEEKKLSMADIFTLIVNKD
jgi:hypothetical protein